MKVIYRNNHAHNLKRGFTLTEVAIVLGVIGLILAGIWTAAAMVYENNRTSKAINEITLITQNLKSTYGGGKSSLDANGTDITAGMIGSGVFPADMVSSSTTSYALAPWPSSQVKIVSALSLNSVGITYSAITPDACLRLGQAFNSPTMSADLTSLTINSTVWTFAPYGTSAAPNLSAIQSACGTSNGSIEFTFTVL